jgi:trans-aconitate methyltransferase
MDTQQAATAFWANHAVDPLWMARYAGSVDQPHRAKVVEALRRLGPFWSLFEIGCHCGPMLRAVLAAFPGVLLGGCDVNAGAVEAARLWLPSVIVGPFPAVTAQMPDQSVDVVLSCYALAYISPEQVGAALAEAGRLAARAVVLCEPMNWDGNTDKRESAFGEWRHPYLKRLMARPEFQGWTARCEELDYPDNYLSGLMVVERP